MWRTSVVVMAVLMLGAFQADGGELGKKLQSKDPQDRASTIAELRLQGPAGLALALAELDALELLDLRSSAKQLSDANSVDAGSKPRNAEEPSQPLLRAREAVDEIAGQRHATVSRLYWYTDLESARSAAQKSGKPILSLRMLGKLTDEFSCANSRFFRTSLYANKAISQIMREKFVLHWQSVRPVPKVTIDFGDGRKLERTITGNSAHYLLDVDGRPLDVLPGLYSPQKFQEWLLGSAKMFDQYQAQLGQANAEDFLASYHQRQSQIVEQAWQKDLQRVELPGAVAPPVAQGRHDASKVVAKFPAAEKAGDIAFAKGRIEGPLLPLAARTAKQADSPLDDATWQKVAALHRDEARLDLSSRWLIAREFPAANVAGVLAVTKMAVENPLLRAIRKFEDSIALDTVRNEYLLHQKIHQWFAQGTAPTDYDALNERVYAELFLTPSSDPWLGLVPADRYTALENEGLSSAN